MDDMHHNQYVKTLCSIAESNDLFLGLINSIPYPIQVFAPDGLLLLLNPAFIRDFHIQDPAVLLGKYNILQDPLLSEYGALQNVKKAFAGKAVYVSDFKVPVHIVKKMLQIPIDEVEAVYQDISTIPLLDATGKLLCVVNIQMTKRTANIRSDISDAMHYIENHLLEAFDLNKLAKSVHLSPAHFSRLFKDSTGMTPCEYALHHKLWRLEVQLTDVNLSITQAFEACGLHYHSHYAKLFKNKTGFSPTEYRKNKRL